MPSDDTAEPPDSKSFGQRLRTGWRRAADNRPLAAAPLASSLLAVDNVRRVRAADGVSVGVTFRFPSALPDLWTFVNVPSQGSGVHVSPTLPLLPAVVLAQAVLAAGLLGSVDQVLRRGRYDFAANARRYFVPMLVLVALARVVALGAVAFAALSLPLVVLFVPVALALSYLFYATPYLIAVADAPVGEALSRSYRWAVAGGPYAAYGAGYLLSVAAVSLFASAFVVNLGVVGVAVGAVVTAPGALALAFATAEFVADVDGADGPRGSGPADRGGVDGTAPPEETAVGDEPDSDRETGRSDGPALGRRDRGGET